MKNLYKKKDLSIYYLMNSQQKQTGLPRPEGQGVQAVRTGVQLVKLKERTKVPTA